MKWASRTTQILKCLVKWNVNFSGLDRRFHFKMMAKYMEDDSFFPLIETFIPNDETWSLVRQIYSHHSNPYRWPSGVKFGGTWHNDGFKQHVARASDSNDDTFPNDNSNISNIWVILKQFCQLRQLPQERNLWLKVSRHVKVALSFILRWIIFIDDLFQRFSEYQPGFGVFLLSRLNPSGAVCCYIYSVSKI